jgi:hypothetical protein
MLRLLVSRLQQESTRLERLAVADRAVSAAISLSYQQLDQPTQLLFRMCHTVRHHDVVAAELAFCIGSTDPDAVEDGLARLVDRSLAKQSMVRVDQGLSFAGYTLFSLIRLFAGQRSAASDDPIGDFERRFVQFLGEQLKEILEGLHRDPRPFRDPAPFLLALDLGMRNPALAESVADLGQELIFWFADRSMHDLAREVEDKLVKVHVHNHDQQAAVRVRLAAAGRMRRTPALVTQAPEMGRLAVALAEQYLLPELRAQAVWETAQCHAALDDWAAALENGAAAIRYLRGVRRVSATVKPLVTMCRFATWAGRQDDALLWASEAVAAGERRAVDKSLLGDAYFELASVQLSMGLNEQSLRSWASARDCYEAVGNHMNAAIASSNATLTTQDWTVRTDCQRRCAESWAKAVPAQPDQVATARLRLSVLYAIGQDLGSAEATLTDAVEDLPDIAGFPLLALEIRVRHAVVRALLGHQISRTWTEADLVAATEARVSREIRAVAESLTDAESRNSLLDFLRAEPRNPVSFAPRRWWHQELDTEARDELLEIEG